MYQLRYENFSENYPKFRSYKIRDAETIQSSVFHKDLKGMISHAENYPKYKNIFLLDESRFSFSRFDIFEEYSEKFTLKDLQDIVKYKCGTQRKKYGLDGEKLTSFIDTIYIEGEPKKYVIG